MANQTAAERRAAIRDAQRFNAEGNGNGDTAAPAEVAAPEPPKQTAKTGGKKAATKAKTNGAASKPKAKAKPTEEAAEPDRDEIAKRRAERKAAAKEAAAEALGLSEPEPVDLVAEATAEANLSVRIPWHLSGKVDAMAQVAAPGKIRGGRKIVVAAALDALTVEQLQEYLDDQQG